jgi:hypothetical protein
MTTLPLSEASVDTLKRLLRDDLPDVKCPHLLEALARSLGFRTQTALKAPLFGLIACAAADHLQS